MHTISYLPDFGCGEVEREIEAGHEILLNSQLADVERMSYVFRMHHQMDFFIDRNNQFAGLNVIAGRNVVFRIEAEEIGIAFVDFFRMQPAKFSIRTRIAEVERELSRLGLNRQRIRGRWLESKL